MYLIIDHYRALHCCCSVFKMALNGDFSPVLAKHSKRFNLIDTLASIESREISSGQDFSI